jgi:predicted NBD/HSP70 family sugar kinase
MPALFGGRRRRPFAHGKELAKYRNELWERTRAVDATLGTVADAIDALRRRALEPDQAIEQLNAYEDELDAASAEIQDMLAPQELHGLHMEYEANLERALRGLVTAERGCALTRLPHRPKEDEEVFSYYKRGHLNIIHARLRMQELVEVLVAWEPGRPTEASLAARLHRDEA